MIQQKENVDPWHERLVIADLWIFIIATEAQDFAYYGPVYLKRKKNLRKNLANLKY